MATELILAIEISQPNRVKAFLGLAKKLKGVNVLQWQSRTAEKGVTAAKTVPEIILIDDIL
jgi:hypothetical protein